jgi:hypothetical protein
LPQFLGAFPQGQIPTHTHTGTVWSLPQFLGAFLEDQMPTHTGKFPLLAPTVVYIHNEFLLSQKNNKILSFAGKWMALEIMLRKICQSHKV